jgi:hypothetical protein
MVTRNFDASKIALIQILDRKNDDAVFTGIDDGSRSKTLNLILKGDAKHGYFGKVEAGANGISDPLGASAGTGIPTFSAAALHYANTWNGEVAHVEGNYQFSRYFTKPIASVQSFQIQSDSVYGQTQQNRSVNSRDQHWINGKYEWSPDPTSWVDTGCFRQFIILIRSLNTNN